MDDAAHLGGVDTLALEDLAHPYQHRMVRSHPIGEDLVHRDAPVGPLQDDVGERAPDVDGERQAAHVTAPRAARVAATSTSPAAVNATP